MSFASAIFQADDFSLAAIGALMEARTLATNKLYYYTAQFAGDTEQTLRQDIGGGVLHQEPITNNLINGMGAPLKIQVTRDLDGRVKAYEVVQADNTRLVPNPYTVDPNNGHISVRRVGPPASDVTVGYVELKTIEGGALSAVQTELNNASAVISSFSNLIAANKQTVKSIFNVIR